ncbi:type II toxin-antitoxin system PemK/MazF family toxin (plasmid) [Embleya sp. NBC_00888]|uniref:type II toxin-antitoxin system PemK/MazF family toxin n=1 Tax=Embleya sp. NBC_00888 TaxID=2975960 RepID=UPI002F918B67|nr:type II toxin-antitoxin system PemK/MazF family toxin [Embleya sp. NBC_00888]
MSTLIPTRGRVYLIAGDEEIGPKPFLVVSNNARNQRLDGFLAVRLTTSPKPDLASIIVLDPADRPLVGRVLCDDLHTIFRDEIVKDMGGLTPHTLQRVGVGLRAALAL